MSEEWRRLGSSSEMLALSSVAQTKNILICLIDLTGPLDVEVVMRSAKVAASKFPQLTSHLKEKRVRGLHYLEWTPVDPDKLPAFFHDLSSADTCINSVDQVLNTLSARLDREWDLFSEVPGEFHCIKLSEGHFLMGWVLHHAAGDAALASDVGQETLIVYNQATSGISATSSREYLSFSGSRKRQARKRKILLSDYLNDIKQTAQNLFARPTLPVGSGLKDDQRQHHAKRVLSETDFRELDTRLKAQGLSLIDTLVASTHYAIDSWNSSRNERSDLLTTSVSVNMRGRFRNIDRENSSSLIFFESTPRDRQNPASFVRSLAIRRIHHFRNHVDLKLTKNIKMMVDAIRIFPYRIRRKIVGFITDQHEFSSAVTLLGVIWPKNERGKITSDSAFTEVGELKVEEILGIPYKMLSKTRLLLTVYVFKRRLNFVLSTSASLFSKEENDQFLALVIENLMSF